MRTVALVVALVVCVHAALWTLLQRHQAVADIEAPLASISYSPYARSQHPDRGDRPTEQQIRDDLKVLSPYTQAIRTYSSTGGLEVVPAIAADASTTTVERPSEKNRPIATGRPPSCISLRVTLSIAAM